MADEIILESLTKEQFECFIKYDHENYLKDFKSDLENLKEVYKMMNGSTFVSEALRKSDQMHQTYKKSSLAMTHKLDVMIELTKSQSKKTYKEDLECEIVMVKMPKCMSWLAYDEPIVDLDVMEDKVDNSSPQRTSQVLPSFEVYIPPMTHPKEVDETIGFPIEVVTLDHTKLEDLGLNTCNHDLSLSSSKAPSVDKPEPQPLPNFPSLSANLEDEKGPKPPIKPHSPCSFRMKIVEPLTIHTSSSPRVIFDKEKPGSS
nr:hypothetical protein [Tanacetum cinerariifolium]